MEANRPGGCPGETDEGDAPTPAVEVSELIGLVERLNGGGGRVEAGSGSMRLDGASPAPYCMGGERA